MITEPQPGNMAPTVDEHSITNTVDDCLTSVTSEYNLQVLAFAVTTARETKTFVVVIIFLTVITHR